MGSRSDKTRRTEPGGQRRRQRGGRAAPAGVASPSPSTGDRGEASSRSSCSWRTCFSSSPTPPFKQGSSCRLSQGTGAKLQKWFPGDGDAGAGAAIRLSAPFSAFRSAPRDGVRAATPEPATVLKRTYLYTIGLIRPCVAAFFSRESFWKWAVLVDAQPPDARALDHTIASRTSLSSREKRQPFLLARNASRTHSLLARGSPAAFRLWLDGASRRLAATARQRSPPDPLAGLMVASLVPRVCLSPCSKTRRRFQQKSLQVETSSLVRCSYRSRRRNRFQQNLAPIPTKLCTGSRFCQFRSSPGTSRTREEKRPSGPCYGINQLQQNTSMVPAKKRNLTKKSKRKSGSKNQIR